MAGFDNGNFNVPGTLETTKGTDVASANDMTLGEGNFFDITGTTTINTIASKGVGTFVSLQFDGILQLTHSADLFLPTADDITTAAGDIAIFYEYASGDWRCQAYTRADGTALASSGGGGINYRVGFNDDYLDPLYEHTLTIPLRPSVVSDALSADRLWFSPIYIGTDVTITDLGVYVQTAAASGKVRFALYEDNGGDTGTRLFESGEIDTTATGFKFVASAQTLTAGAYWFACICDNATLRLSGCDYALGFMPMSRGIVLSSKAYVATSYGEIPASYTFNGKTIVPNADATYLLHCRI